jgi:hypothetical protein
MMFTCVQCLDQDRLLTTASDGLLCGVIDDSEAPSKAGHSPSPSPPWTPCSPAPARATQLARVRARWMQQEQGYWGLVQSLVVPCILHQQSPGLPVWQLG